MRAQRDTVHPTSRRASPARRNPPALDSCEPTWRNASPGDITETTPPGVGRPRGWRHRVCQPKRLPRGWGRSWRRRDRAATKRLPPGSGGLAGGRRGRHDRGHPDRLGRSSLSSSTTASTSVRPGPPGTAAARTWGAADDEDRQGRPGRGRRAHIKSRTGRPPGRPRRVIRRMCTFRRSRAIFPPVSARGVAGTCARGRPWGNLTLVRATARVRTSLLLSRRGGA